MCTSFRVLASSFRLLLLRLCSNRCAEALAFNMKFSISFPFVPVRWRVDDLSFFKYLSSLCFSSIEFHCTFSISYKICHILFIIIVFWLGCDRPSGLLMFVPALLLTIFVCLFVLFRSCCSHACVFGKTLVHEFPMSYSHTEWYLHFFPRRNSL